MAQAEEFVTKTEMERLLQEQRRKILQEVQVYIQRQNDKSKKKF